MRYRVANGEMTIKRPIVWVFSAHSAGGEGNDQLRPGLRTAQCLPFLHDFSRASPFPPELVSRLLPVMLMRLLTTRSAFAIPTRII
jgi:hypothetical protein